MFQAQKREIIIDPEKWLCPSISLRRRAWQDRVSQRITKTKTDLLVSDRSCPQSTVWDLITGPAYFQKYGTRNWARSWYVV